MTNNVPWYWAEHTAYRGKTLESDTVYDYSWVHTVVRDGEPNSSLYDLFQSIDPIFRENLPKDAGNLIRIKIGLHTAQQTYNTNDPHVDNIVFPHYVILYYVNDSDGDTIFYDQEYDGYGERIDDTNTTEYIDKLMEMHKGEWKENLRVTPKANTAVIFTGEHFHSSTNPVNTNRRVTINLNYRIKDD